MEREKEGRKKRDAGCWARVRRTPDEPPGPASAFGLRALRPRARRLATNEVIFSFSRGFGFLFPPSGISLSLRMLPQEKSRVVEMVQRLAPRALCYRAGRGADSREHAGGRREEVSSLGKVGKARAEPGGRSGRWRPRRRLGPRRDWLSAGPWVRTPA